MCAALGACDRSPSATMPTDQPLPANTDKAAIRIALIGPGENDPTYPLLQAAAEWCMRAQRNCRIDVLAPRLASSHDQRQLLAHLNRVMDENGEPIDAVCVLPIDTSHVALQLAAISRRGIPVVTVGQDDSATARWSHCGPVELDMGRAAARAAQQAVVDRSESIMLLHSGGSTDPGAGRYLGFHDELEMLSGVRLLREIDCKGKPVDAVSLVREEARRFPRVGCWVLLDDWPLRVQPRELRLLPSGCVIVLCDGSPRYFELLREGRIFALIGYNVRKAVDEALGMAVRHLQRETFADPNVFTLPVEIITLQRLTDVEATWEQWAVPDMTAPQPD